MITRTDIDKRYTARIAEKLAEGYTILTAAMEGCQVNEIAHVCMSKDKDICSVLMRKGDHYSRCGDTFELVELHAPYGYELRPSAILWREKMIETDWEKYVEIHDGLFADDDEYAVIRKKRNARRKGANYYWKCDWLEDDSHKRIAQKHLQRMPGFKSVRKSEIDRVLRYRGRNYLCYIAMVRGKTPTIFESGNMTSV